MNIYIFVHCHFLMCNPFLLYSTFWIKTTTTPTSLGNTIPINSNLKEPAIHYNALRRLVNLAVDFLCFPYYVLALSSIEKRHLLHPLPKVSLKFALIWAVNDIIFPMGSDFSRSSLECVSLDSQQSSANKEQTSIWSNSNDLPESIVCCSLHTHSTECYRLTG